MLLVEIKDFYTLIYNKAFLDQPKKMYKTHRKNFSKYLETMVIQQETCWITRIIKTVINVLV